MSSASMRMMLGRFEVFSSGMASPVFVCGFSIAFSIKQNKWIPALAGMTGNPRE